MRFFVAVTDDEWFRYLSSLRPAPDEINFWTGTPANHPIGTPWLFKLHSPNNFIVGGGYFTYYTQMPLVIVWETFQEKNGVSSLLKLQQRLAKYRDRQPSLMMPIGCAVLSAPFFLSRDRWLPIPKDWSQNIVSRKSYDTDSTTGAELWNAIEEQLPNPIPALREAVKGGFGKPQLIRPRLNQGAFRLMVTDAYNRRCAVTGEKALPALEASHIIPYAATQTHEVRNGILLRADIHRLFDLGYVTISPDYKFLAGKSIHDDFANGADYYALDGRMISLPENTSLRPDPALLEQHVSTVYRR